MWWVNEGSGSEAKRTNGNGMCADVNGTRNATRNGTENGHEIIEEKTYGTANNVGVRR